MTAGEILDFVDHVHEQRYHASCSPSVIEMMLKCVGAVEFNYFDLQRENQNSDGGINVYLNKNLPGGYTLRSIAQSKAWEFPFQAICGKLETGMPVGVYLDNTTKTASHGWLVLKVCYSAMGCRALLCISKPSEMGGGEGKRTLFRIVDEGDNLRCSDPVFLEKTDSVFSG